MHKEAFCLMWYACKCGHRERIWNSRDGVTPFGASCPSCSMGIMNHVNWQDDEPAPDYRPKIGQRYWRDGTPDEAEAIMRRRIEKAKGSRWEANEELAAKLIQSARDGGEGEFQKGWPMLAAAEAPGLPDDRSAVDKQSAGSVNQSSRPDQGTVAVSSADRKAPASCPNCFDETDCSNVDICRAVEEAYTHPSTHRESGAQ